MKRHRVVIIGGGFGGIKVALDLSQDRRFLVTLVSDHADFRYYPTLYRTATGGRKMISSVPLTEIFAGKPVQLLNDTVTGLDRANKLVTTKVNHTIGYDFLVVALGVKTNYFHIQGLEELSYGIKTPADAQELKLHLHKQLVEDKRPDLNYVVIGGGPTGIELAGVLPSYIKQICRQHNVEPRPIHVDLVEAAPRLVPRMPKDIGKHLAKQLRHEGVKLYLNAKVEGQTADELMVNGKPIRSHTVIWTAGVANNPFIADQGFQLAKNGKARVDQYLQAEKDIYIVGDNADTPYSGMAQTALHDGGFLAQNLQRLRSGKEAKPYSAKKPIYVFPAGHHWAAVLWGRVRIYGKLGWLLRSAADLIAYHDYEPWQLATKRWLAEDDTEEFCPHCNGELSVEDF
jgi:NADH dehydrogenase